MSLALCIAFVFQTVLRTPARKKLRLQLAAVTHSLASYNILFQALMTAAVPVDVVVSDISEGGEGETKRLAIETIRLELIARESRIQTDILSLFPLLRFSAVEPAFGQPFQSAIMGKLISKHQFILGASHSVLPQFPL